MFEKSEKPAKRSPIKDAPLRLPGESLREHFNDVLMARATQWSLMLVVLPVMAAVEWLRYWLKSPATLSSSITLTVTAAAGACLAVFRIWRMIPEARATHLGMHGEIAVGQFLEDFCRNNRGYRVLHDIPGRDFNVDHVLIGPGGVFVIETKTISKPTAGKPTVTYDGQRVLVDGFAPDRDPIAQVKACTDHIRDLLARSTGRDPRSFPIRPVVLYPGWYIEGSLAGREVWVHNVKSFIGFLRNERQKLKSEDIALLHSRLAMDMRAKS